MMAQVNYANLMASVTNGRTEKEGEKEGPVTDVLVTTFPGHFVESLYRDRRTVAIRFCPKYFNSTKKQKNEEKGVISPSHLKRKGLM